MIHNPKQSTKPHKKLKQKEIKEGQCVVAHNKICKNDNCSYEFVKNQIDPSAADFTSNKQNTTKYKSSNRERQNRTQRKKLNIANGKIEHGKFMILANLCKEL